MPNRNNETNNNIINNNITIQKKWNLSDSITQYILPASSRWPLFVSYDNQDTLMNPKYTNIYKHYIMT